MVGKNKGVAAFIHKENASVYVNGCPCQLMHLAAKKACTDLPVQIDELLIDIFYYIDKSSNRLQNVKTFQALCNTEVHKILKHAPTRWLSLAQCTERLLEQWEPLQQSFSSETRSQSKSVTRKDTVQSSHSSVEKTAKSSSSHSQSSQSKAQSASHSSVEKTGPQFDISAYIFKQQSIAQLQTKAKHEQIAKQKLTESSSQNKVYIAVVSKVHQPAA